LSGLRRPSLADVIPLLTPKLAPALLEDGRDARLERMAAALAPLYQGGFEVRLATDSSEVDLHQYVLAGDGQPSELLSHLQGDPSPNSGTQGLVRLCRAWCAAESPLAITELWLECDDGPTGTALRPSVFVGLTPGAQAGDNERTARTAVQHVMTDEQIAACWTDVRRRFTACAEPAWVSHIGAMVGRTPPALRMNVKRLPRDGIVPYLEETGWHGPRAELSRVVEWLAASVDTITVCGDVPAGSTVGFECSFAEQPRFEPRWAALLDDLVDREVCAPGKRDALLAWHEVIAPPNSAAPWPDPLIVAALQSPADAFGAIDCRVSHVKVIYEPGRPLRAKGYLSFTHGWLAPDATSESPSRARVRSAARQQ
jgi:hypothetical protein